MAYFAGRKHALLSEHNTHLWNESKGSYYFDIVCQLLNYTSLPEAIHAKNATGQNWCEQVFYLKVLSPFMFHVGVPTEMLCQRSVIQTSDSKL